MAKTFKTTSAPAATEPAKPISERDFFDLTDEPVTQLADKQGKELENTGNTSNNRRVVNIGNSKNTSNTTIKAADSVMPEERDLRQTFVVSSGQLEQLRDYVHARRVTGDYEYSQKQALQEALSLLFASVPQAPPRPSQTRELEQRRRERIRRGRGA
jgi:hypothetical protein